jgi:LysM repeat protein
LYAIAAQHGISVSELKKINNLTSDVIKPGQSLKVQK